MKHIALIGCMGCGKSTVGKALSALLQYPFYDTDAIIEARERKTVSTLFDTVGEAAFRGHEQQTIIELLNRRQPSVIACGGGAPCHSHLIDRLNEHAVTVYLKTAPDTLCQRLQQNTEQRPLLKNRPNLLPCLIELLAQRAPIYQQAHIVIPTDTRTPEAIAQEIMKNGEWRAGAR